MDKNIIKEIILKIDPHSRSEKTISHRFPEIHKFLISEYPSDLTYGERIYWILHGLKDFPKCEFCGGPSSFRSIAYGYNNCCCPKCASSNPSRVKKSKNTKQQKYGDPNYNNRQKAEQTCIEKFGVSNPFAAKEIQEQIRKGYQETYGVDYPSQSQEIQNTRRKNTIEKYGVDHHSKLESVKKKITKSNQQIAMQGDPDILGYNDKGEQIRRCPHSKCNKCSSKTYVIGGGQYCSRIEMGIEECTNILPIKWGKNKDSYIEIFIRDLLDSQNTEYETNNRKILPGKKELDIYIPSKNLAIECNGSFWHSLNHRTGSDYHLNKYIHSKENGITLLTIWEDWIRNKPKIVKSIILTNLGLYETFINSNECHVEEISPEKSRDFLETNHIRGKSNAIIRLGLFHDKILVGVMTFSKNHKSNQSDSWSITRACYLLNSQITGGYKKLLEYFIIKYKPKFLSAFSSNDINDKAIWEDLNFEKTSSQTPSLWYISKKNWRRYGWSSFTKSRLKKLGYNITNKTVEEIMKTLPFWRIYDSGQTKYTLNL